MANHEMVEKLVRAITEKPGRRVCDGAKGRMQNGLEWAAKNWGGTISTDHLKIAVDCAKQDSDTHRLINR